MLKDDGLAKEIGLDKTMLLEAALEREAEAAACPSLSEVAGFSGEEQRIRGGKSLDFGLYPSLHYFTHCQVHVLFYTLKKNMGKILKGKIKIPFFTSLL